MRRKNSSRWLIIILILFIFLISEMFLPGLAVDRIRRILSKSADEIDRLDINVAAFPALKVLLGKVDHIVLNAEGLLVDDLLIDDLVINYRDVSFNRSGFDGINTGLQAVITEDSLNNYIHRKYSELDNFFIKIEPERISLQGYVNIFEAKIRVLFAGNFVINDRDIIYFVPSDVQVEDVKLPANLIKSYMEDLDFSFDLKELDIPLSIDELQLSPGKISITGGEFNRRAETG